MLKQYKLRDYNFRLVLWLIALSTLGVLLVGSAEASLENKQLAGVILGVFIMLILSLIDFSWILNFYWIIYGVNILLLLLVIVAGSSAGGATRWFAIGGFRFQPVELSKILLILFFSKYFMVHENDLNKPKIILRSLALIGLPLILIFRQPDLKNTITIFILFSLLYYAAGLSYKFIFSVLAIVIVLGAVFMTIVIQPNQSLIKDYQRKRIMAFLNPDSPEYTDDTTQQNNSVTAIGSGELTGKGLNNSSVSSANKGNFISQIQTDFIFAVLTEKMGFIGGFLVLALFAGLLLRALYIASRAEDRYGIFIATGVVSMLMFHLVINIGMNIGLMPVTGIPLPFLSYGGTSLLISLFAVGLLESIAVRRKKIEFGS